MTALWVCFFLPDFETLSGVRASAPAELCSPAESVSEKGDTPSATSAPKGIAQDLKGSGDDPGANNGTNINGLLFSHIYV